MKTYTFISRSILLQSTRFVFVVLISVFCTNLAFAGAIHDAARKGDLNKLKTLLQADPKLVGVFLAGRVWTGNPGAGGGARRVSAGIA